MEVDIQNSPMDADGFYLTPAGTSYKITTWTQVGGSNNWFAWVELEPLSDVFVTLKVISNPNSVKLAAKLNYV
jgi:hypothetical protein